MRPRTRYEQETTITFNAEEPHLILYTAWPPMLRKLKKWGFEPETKLEGAGIFKLSKKCCSVHKIRAKRSGILKHAFGKEKKA